MSGWKFCYKSKSRSVTLEVPTGFVAAFLIGLCARVWDYFHHQ